MEESKSGMETASFCAPERVEKTVDFR